MYICILVTDSIYRAMKLAEIENRLRRFRVGIAGAGGLGSNCAVALARCGIGTIVISDFDIVEESNLSRQYYFRDQIGLSKTLALKENIRRIRQGTTIIALQERLDSRNIPVIFSGCNVLVEAFDKPEMKEMMVDAVHNSMPGIPLVIGSGMAGWGNSAEINYRKIDDSLYVCGDESSEATDDLPVLAPRVGMVANMQANVVIDILLTLA